MPQPQSESVKISKKVVDKVRNNKKKTGVSVGIFFAIAATEKLKSLTTKKINNEISC